MFRFLRVAALTFTGWLWPGLARAEAALEVPEPSVAYAPPSGRALCSGTPELETRLRTLLEQSACGAPERQLLVTLQAGEAVSGTLVVLHDYQAEYVREVSGPSCGEVEAALTLALEIYLDPGEPGDSACTPKTPPPAPTSSAATWPGQDIDPFDLPEPEPPPVPTVIEPQPSALVRAMFHIDSSYAPTVAVGVAAVARIRVTPQNFVGVTLAHQTAPPFPAADSTIVHVSATALGVSLGQHLPLGKHAEFSIEVGPRLGVLETGTAVSAEWRLAETIGIALNGSLGVRVAKGLWTGVQAGGTFNVLRARYLDSDNILAWEQPWTGGFVGVYFAAAVPGRPRQPSRPTSEPKAR